MPNYVVEIEWPLTGNNAGQSFWPSAVVRDEDETGIPPPANNHKVTFTLYHTPNGAPGDLKDTRDSDNFDASTEPTVTSMTAMTTDMTGSHRLVATLIKLADGSTVDTDEELDINITVNGPQRREIFNFIIEE